MYETKVANWATRLLYEFSVKKLVFLGFRAYLGEIESEKEKVRKFRIRFFSHNQWCQG